MIIGEREGRGESTSRAIKREKGRRRTDSRCVMTSVKATDRSKFSRQRVHQEQWWGEAIISDRAPTIISWSPAIVRAADRDGHLAPCRPSPLRRNRKPALINSRGEAACSWRIWLRRTRASTPSEPSSRCREDRRDTIVIYRVHECAMVNIRGALFILPPPPGSDTVLAIFVNVLKERWTC